MGICNENCQEAPDPKQGIDQTIDVRKDYSQFKQAVRNPNRKNEFILVHKTNEALNRHIEYLIVHEEGQESIVEWLGLSQEAEN